MIDWKSFNWKLHCSKLKGHYHEASGGVALRHSFLYFLDEPEPVSEGDIKSAQQELLKAKAAYQVRTNIIENVLVANPILNAVHSGPKATIIEQ